MGSIAIAIIPCDILAIGYFHIGVPSRVFML
jgi:hypothetical protein